MPTQPATAPAGVTFDAPLQQATSVTVPAGVTFDAPLKQSQTVSLSSTPDQTSAPANQPPASSQPATGVPTAITADPNDSLLMKGVKGVGGLFQGIGEGVFSTAAGASNLIDDKTGMQRGAVNRYLNDLSTDQGHATISPQSVGQVGETVGEFLLGDEALKGLSLSERLARTAKVVKLLESHPLAAKAFNIGVAALRQGAVQGIQTGIRTGGDTHAAGEQGLLAGGLTAGFGAAGETYRALRGALDSSSLQKPLQSAITKAITQTAQEHGIAIPEGASARDVAQSLSDSLRAKASGLYKQLDSALGGTRFQTFDDQLGNIQRAIRDNLGIDPQKDTALAKRLQQVTDARQAAMDGIRAKGLDPENLIGQADALHQRAMALQDVSKAVRASTDVHPSAGNTANVKTAPFFRRMQGLATPNPRFPGAPSRLAQALGEQRAAELLETVDHAHLAAQRIAARNAWIKKGATAVGLTGLGAEAYRTAHDLLSGGQ